MTARSIRLLICLGLLLTPIFYLPAILEMTARVTAGGVPPARDLIAIKAAKDILLVVICLLFLLDVLRGGRFVASPFVLFLAVGIGISFCVSFLRAGPLLAMIGLRSISPFVLILVGYRYVDMKSLGVIVRVLGVLLLIETCAAVVRALYGVPVDGRTIFGLVARPSGTFTSPTSWSVFISMMCCYIAGFDISLHGRLRSKTKLVVVASGVLVYFAAAGAGILAFAAFLMSYFLCFSKAHACLKAAIAPLLLSAPILILNNLPVLTGRPGAYRSVESRVGIITNVISSMNLGEIAFGKGLGVGSDAAVTLQRIHPEMLAGVDYLFGADSLYAAMVGQMGVVFLAVFLVFNWYLLAKALRFRDRGVHPIVVLAIPSILVGAGGSVTTEVFPVNWLLFLLYGMALQGGNAGEGFRYNNLGICGDSG